MMLVAPWRSAVAMQSVPVSPPPMTTTFLPSALMYLRVGRKQQDQRTDTLGRPATSAQAMYAHARSSQDEQA
jgi:hypothetical protein